MTVYSPNFKSCCYNPRESDDLKRDREKRRLGRLRLDVMVGSSVKYNHFFCSFSILFKCVSSFFKLFLQLLILNPLNSENLQMCGFFFKILFNFLQHSENLRSNIPQVLLCSQFSVPLESPSTDRYPYLLNQFFDFF